MKYKSTVTLNNREFRDIVTKNLDVINSLQTTLPVAISYLESTIIIESNDEPAPENPNCSTDKVLYFIESLRELRSMGVDLGISKTLKELADTSGDYKIGALFKDAVIKVGPHRNPVVPRTLGQIKYLETIDKNDITLVNGDAGSGKTFLAVAAAVSYILSGRCERLILSRPVVEAGENLGFLPGNLEEKIAPYLTPLYDSLHKVLAEEDLERLIRKGNIEMAPLAYMRGRTLEKAFIILDEAQNTTPDQMLMFLTRLGHGSKCVVSGDDTQIDLPRNRYSGLTDAMSRLDDIPGIGMHHMGPSDIVRHKLVSKIIDRYNKDGAYV